MTPEKKKEEEALAYLRARYEHVYVVKEGESEVELALDILRRDYSTDINDIATDFLSEAEDQGADGWSRDSALDWLHETLDGCHRVVYTLQSQLGLAISRHASAGVDEGLVDFSDGMPWAGLMYAAMEQDVMEELTRRGVDLNADPIYHPEAESDDDLGENDSED